MTRDEIVAEARTYLGVRFKMRGRNRMGLDCVGLLIVVAQSFGQKITDRTDYSMKQPFEVALNSHLKAHSNPAPLKPFRHGQIVKFRQSVLPMHLGIITLDGTEPMVIDAHVKKKKVVEEPLRLWSNLILELREFKGVT